LRLARGRRSARRGAVVAAARRSAAARDARPGERQEQHPGDKHGEHDGPAPASILSEFVWHGNAPSALGGGDRDVRRVASRPPLLRGGGKSGPGGPWNVILACAPSGGDKGCARKATLARRASRTGSRRTGESPARLKVLAAVQDG